MAGPSAYRFLSSLWVDDVLVDGRGQQTDTFALAGHETALKAATVNVASRWLAVWIER